jgi:transposase
LQYHFNWKTLSAIAGITWWNFYFRLYPGAVRGPQVVNSLRHLSRHLRGKLLVIWDGLPCHRSRLVREYLEQQAGRIVIERLPAYAPELNPVEYMWGVLEEPSTAQPLSAGLLRAWLPCPSGSAPDATPSDPGGGLLGASQTAPPNVTILCDSQ